MNHQIEDNVHIERPWSEDAKAVNLKKHGLRDEWRRGPDRRIEAFQVSDLADPIQTPRQANQFIGFRQRRGERLFNQHIDSGFHQGPGSGEVQHSGDGDGGGVDGGFGFAREVEKFIDGGEGARLEFFGSGGGLRFRRLGRPLLCRFLW